MKYEELLKLREENGVKEALIFAIMNVLYPNKSTLPIVKCVADSGPQGIVAEMSICCKEFLGEILRSFLIQIGMRHLVKKAEDLTREKAEAFLEIVMRLFITYGTRDEKGIISTCCENLAEVLMRNDSSQVEKLLKITRNMLFPFLDLEQINNYLCMLVKCDLAQTVEKIAALQELVELSYKRLIEDNLREIVGSMSEGTIPSEILKKTG